jgi:hypothetical protein
MICGSQHFPISVCLKEVSAYKEHPSSISRKAVTNREKDSNCYGRKINNQFTKSFQWVMTSIAGFSVESYAMDIPLR